MKPLRTRPAPASWQPDYRACAPASAPAPSRDQPVPAWITRARLGLGAGLLAGLAGLPSGLSAQEDIGSYKKLSLQELMDIEVTSVSRRPEKLSDTASALQVINDGDIRRSGATRLPEALRLANNLNVAQRGSQGWAISARGFNTELSNKLLVLMDGRTIYSPLFSGVFWEAQDYVLEDIDRIEVISGPGGTLWGANAVNGVINITSKNARDTQGLYANAAVGDELEALASVRYGGALSRNVHYRVYGKFTERDGGAYPDGSDAPADWDARRGGFRVDGEPNLRNTFTVQGDIYDNNADRALGSLDMGGGNLLGRWTHVLENDSEMTLQAYYDHTRLSQPVGPTVFTPAGRFADELDTYDLDFQHQLAESGRHHVIWGLGYRRTHDVVENAASLGFVPERLDQDLYSAFVQDRIELAPDWYLTLGSKIEHNDYTGFEYEPSARLQWTINPDHMLWSAVSRAVRMPSRIDRDIRQPNVATPILRGGDDFRSETVIAYEVGYRAQLGPRVLAAISAFYNHYDDLRSLATTPGTFIPLFFENNLEGETYGFELTTTYEVLDGWRLHGGYTLLLEDLRVKPGRSDFNNALNETADPRHQVSVRSSWDLPRRIEIDAGLRWIDTLEVNNVGSIATVPSYFELDVRVAWRPTDTLEFSVVGQNLLHDQHPEYGVPGATREEVERSVYAKIAWHY